MAGMTETIPDASCHHPYVAPRQLRHPRGSGNPRVTNRPWSHCTGRPGMRSERGLAGQQTTNEMSPVPGSSPAIHGYTGPIAQDAPARSERGRRPTNDERMSPVPGPASTRLVHARPTGVEHPRTPARHPALAARRRCDRDQSHRHGVALGRRPGAVERRAPGSGRAPAPELRRGRRGHHPHQQLRGEPAPAGAAWKPGPGGRAQRSRRPHRAAGSGRKRAPDRCRRLHGPHRRALRCRSAN